MVHGIIIPASDAQDMQAVELAELEDYQRAVGGWIEALDILGFGCTMYLNEEGLIRGLPYNRRATYLWWYHVPHARGHARLARDAVLVGLPDHNGRTTDVSPAARDLLLGSTLCQVQSQRLNSGQWRAVPSKPQSYIEAVVGATLMMECAPDRLLRVVPRQRRQAADRYYPGALRRFLSCRLPTHTLVRADEASRFVMVA